ncbi:heavy-metal-associated domain-containing protein [Silicimonas sp. MF1-12-2]|uniref:heavy-metal-associated domain-containing protein n=1 Tax=Silicimonas sp. MF1-12-2 TaxID=3384793 RepID=UPI0039B6B425
MPSILRLTFGSPDTLDRCVGNTGDHSMKEFHVPDMSCGHCKATIEKALLSVDPDAGVEVDLEARRVKIAGNRSTDELLAAMKSAGYEATAVG